MYIGHYKAVNSSREFYSTVRKDLDFPIQAKYKGERYLLFSTYIASTPSQKNNITSRAKELNIPNDISVD
jgi:hypothetical protein